MSLFSLLIIVSVCGAMGGAVNALLSENGFILPKKISTSVPGELVIWRPGYIGNMLVGAVASVISWGLYGPFSSAILFGPNSQVQNTPHLTLSAFVGAILVGVGGAKWLSDEVDKRLLKAAASQAARKEASSEAAIQMSLSSPVGALNVAKSI